MLTFTPLGDAAFRLSGPQKDLIVFPAKTGTKDAITMLPVPEEVATPGTISWPGEYNVAGVSIRGVGHGDGQQVSFVVEVDNVRMAFISAPLQEWTDKQMELVGDIDVIVAPAVDAKQMQKIVDDFDPRIVLLLPTKDKDALAAISKSIGAKETMGEYKLKGSLPAEGREVIVLA